MGNLLPHHERVLQALDRHSGPHGEHCIGFSRLSSVLKMTRREARRITRHLARKGYAEYHRALVNEYSGEFAGAGYCITPAGRAALTQGDLP